MPLTDFAHEIQLHIVQFCSRNDVASLSRIHTALQDVAESVLYSHVVIEGESDRSLGLAKLDKGQTQPSLKENRSPLYALFSNSRKAAMVKALRVDLGCPYKISGRGWYNYDDDWLHGFVVNKIAEALEQMLNLVDLRVRSGRAGEAFKGSITSIGEVIRGGHFQLHTLCLSHYVHDLEGIIVSQPNLRLFGVYYHFRLCATVCKKLDGVFQHLLSHRHTIELKLFLLHYSKSKDGSTAVINMLPFLHRPGEALQTCIEAEKLTEWPDDFREASGHSSLSLVGISEENISLLEESMEAMAECVQRGHPYLSNPRLRIHVQHTKIQKPWNFPEFVKPLALFENVEKSLFYFPDCDKNELLPLGMELSLCLMEDLGRRWPKIRKIRLWGKESTIMLGRANEWPVDVANTNNLRMDLILDGWH